eukprot:3095635-Rhodomonas_salina.2
MGDLRRTAGQVGDVVLGELEDICQGDGRIGLSRAGEAVRPVMRHAENGVKHMLGVGTAGLAPGGSYCGKCLDALHGAGAVFLSPGAVVVAGGAGALAGAGVGGPVVVAGGVIAGGMAGSAVSDGVQRGVKSVADRRSARRPVDSSAAGSMPRMPTSRVYPENFNSVFEQPMAGNSSPRNGGRRNGGQRSVSSRRGHLNTINS